MGKRASSDMELPLRAVLDVERGHFVERWGRGISLILSKEPTAAFKDVAGLFITTFQRKKHTQDETEAEKSNIKSLSEKQKSESDEVCRAVRRSLRVAGLM